MENRSTPQLKLTGNQLSAENSDFRRTWRISTEGHLHPESFLLFASGYEWLTPPESLPTAAIDATLTPWATPSSIEADSICAELRVAEQAYLLQVFHKTLGVRVRGVPP